MAGDQMLEVKQELIDSSLPSKRTPRTSDFTNWSSIIDLSSSDSDSDTSSDDDDANLARNSNGGDGNAKKKRKKTTVDSDKLLPLGFLDRLPSKQAPVVTDSTPRGSASANGYGTVQEASSRQFWKAGDYEGASGGDWNSVGGMDHVRVHPKFLHSNATSHKWVLGAFAELLDNSLDEVCNGATYVNIDMLKSKKDGTKMLLIEDDGGGMDPDKMRHCMSLGYSAKSKMINTIGQYGNGFKTSTMRLGADVIVFSRGRGKDGRQTQSIGLLSYTFLKGTGKEDIVVPMLDYERSGQKWNKIIRSSASDWDLNVETIVQWSPFSNEADLLRQFAQMKDHGTRIIIYNLWEDDEGLLELDFDTDSRDIQIRGVNRDERSIEMAKRYPNSRHFLTYRHSLRSYAAILYLRVPPGFRMILRGKDIEHHNVVNDMMMSQEVIYRPQPGADGVPKDANMVAVVTVGFVKDAKEHIDVQGFNVYHKNRLIKPFWRVWHPPGSSGRGVIGVLEANFVEPAHDKQGFERTTVLARLETRLIQMQREYWTSKCHKIGYVGSKKSHEKGDKTYSKSVGRESNNGDLNGTENLTPRKRPSYTELSSDEDTNDNYRSKKRVSGKDGSSERPSVSRHNKTAQDDLPSERSAQVTKNSNSKGDCSNGNEVPPGFTSNELIQLKKENHQLKERLKKREEQILGDLLQDLQKEKERSTSLETQLQEATRKYEDLSKEQDSIIDIFSEERQRRDGEEEILRKKLKEASVTIEKLVEKVRLLEKRK